MVELVLKNNPTLLDFQKYVAQMVKDRGFDKQTVQETFMRFLEESGEMAKAGRKKEGMKIDNNSNEFHFGHEAADVLIYLLALCNHFEVNLESAFREKEEINKKRIWQ